MRAPITLVVCAVAACDLDPSLVVRDAGSPANTDAGVVDAGVADAGIVEDAGVDAGEPCVFPKPEPLEYIPNGTEDFIDPLDGEYPSVDVLATWSRIEGDELVIEVLFAAPPFRTNIPDPPDYNGAVEIGFLVDAADDGGAFCEDPSAQPQRNCTFIDSYLAVQDQPDFRGWPPEGSCVKASWVSGACGELDFCDQVLVTPTEPFLQLRVSAAELRVDESSSYVVKTRHPFGVWVSWGVDPSDTIEMRGGSAPTSETFVSICDIPCPR